MEEDDVFTNALDIVHQMTGHQNRAVGAVDHGVERGNHELPRFRIEAVGWFVGDEQIGVVDDGTGQFRGLLHAG